MKVLKFGGTSVGSAVSLGNISRIVGSREEGEVVVVSALGGVTDKLISASRMAERGDGKYVEEWEQIKAFAKQLKAKNNNKILDTD